MFIVALTNVTPPHSNRRLDNKFNIFEGISKNWIFIAISVVMCGAQVLIIFYGGAVFNIPEEGQTAVHWGIALVLGAISIPVGVVIRLIPDHLVEALIPRRLFNRHTKTPGLTLSDEDDEADDYDSPFHEVRDQLAFLKRVKGGRLNNLKFAMRHPRETMKQRSSRSPSHSRAGSVPPSSAAGPNADDGRRLSVDSDMDDAAAAEARMRAKSMRGRSNSALGAPTVMAGLVAAGVAAGWQPGARTQSRPENRAGQEETKKEENGAGLEV